MAKRLFTLMIEKNLRDGKAVKYGVTGQYIQGLEIVSPTGEIIQLGGKRVKDVTGKEPFPSERIGAALLFEVDGNHYSIF